MLAWSSGRADSLTGTAMFLDVHTIGALYGTIFLLVGEHSDVLPPFCETWLDEDLPSSIVQTGCKEESSVAETFRPLIPGTMI